MASPCKMEDRVSSGRRLSQPPRGDEVVISGLAGSFPDSDSVHHLQENLFNKVDLVSDDDRRWKIAHLEIPQRTGKLNQINKFDAEFFGVHYKEAHTMDPMGRILLEKTYEAIIDAGMNPIQLNNKKVGVFVGVCVSETEKVWVYDNMQIQNFGATGCNKSMLANRLSQWLGVTGPSYSMDTACSSSLTALDHAFRAIRDGLCDSAIVAGSNLCLHPYVSLQFFRLGVLASDGRCKSFDNNCNGYVRSEAIVVCYLQKAKDARRAYAQIVYTKANCDGFKEHGISYPSGHMQKVLMQDFYEECSVPPESVEFVEAHGTGTKAGDPEELTAIDEVFCTGRDQPLLIGSVKSNIGHTEPSSGLCGLAKMCIAYSNGYLPPNINFTTPRESVEALTSGRMQVVVEKQPWSRGLSAVSNFGFGGANVHVLLKNFARNKVNCGLPLDSLPRLVCASGRTEAAVARILDDLESRPLDAEQARLWHAVHDQDIPGHAVRGYTLLRSYASGSAPSQAQSIARSVSRYAGARRPLWFVYSGAEAWPSMAAGLMEIPIFASTITKCHEALAPLGVNLAGIVTDPDLKASVSPAHASTAGAAVQVAFTDLLTAVGIKPDHFIGHGAGELVCAYADGCWSAEQTVLAAYYCSHAAVQHSTIRSKRSNIFKNLKDDIPSPTPRSKRWVATLMPQQTRNDDRSEFSFTEYHGNNMEEAALLIPLAAITVEIASHAQGTLVRRGKDAVHVTLMHQGPGDSVQALLTGLGKLYEAGLNPHLAELYPPVQFPVSIETPMMGHLVEWEHSHNWYVIKYKVQEALKANERTVNMSLVEETLKYLGGHVVDGRKLFPATGYLVMVWDTLGMMTGTYYSELSVVFENVRFLRATNIPKDRHIEFNVAIQDDGHFEIVESGTPVVTGRILAQKGVGRNFRPLPPPGAGAAPPEYELLTKDFYKELRLRGYQYSGLFRGVTLCSLGGSHGRLAWHDNWVTFMDSMLQLQLLGHDTRALAVPTRIDRLVINADVHYQAIRTLDPKLDPPTLDVCVYRDAGIIRSGGIEIRGVHAASIARRVLREAPVLEKNLFVPNYGKASTHIEDILRVNIHIALENLQVYKVKSIELIDEEYTKNGYKPVIEQVSAILGDMPLIQAELMVISEQLVPTPPHITVENKTIASETNTTLFIGANILSRPGVMDQALSTLKERCFIMSREKERPSPNAYADKYDIVTIHDTGFEYVVLLRQKVTAKPAKYIKITACDTYSWMESVKNELKEAQKLVLYAQDDNNNINGLLGLINCLRREPGGEVVYGLLISDQSAPLFSPDSIFYAVQLEKDLVHNIFQDGEWGTYRYFLLDVPDTVPVDHAYVSTVTVGDLSSMRWVEGPLKHDSVLKDSESVLVHVYCAALNFHDVMTATGRVTLEAVASSRLAQECAQGLEVVGRTSNGSRVMGFGGMGMSNLVPVSKSLLWPIPDDWTFEDAVTVPVVYVTVYDALVMKGKVEAGESVLIHAGSGGVGQAAISVALHWGCEVFTTVSTAEKRAFIKRLFPALKDSHIGNSRDTSFENMIRRETNGKGVDLVLNCLSDEKLQASVRCLGYRGRFLEIGVYDINNNTPVNLLLAQKEISFHGVMLKNIYHWSSEIKRRVQDLVTAGIESGAVRPLTRCSFQKQEVEHAFRYMAAGKHVGKLIIKIRDEEGSQSVAKAASILMDAVPRYMCCPESVYVVVGGLGGFGLELADWLVLRGARWLLLGARRGLASGYQAARMRAWESYGACVQVTTHDASSEAGCAAMLRAACAMGPVRAVFNLAVVLKNAVFENQTPEMFKESFAPKALVTMHLDKLTRTLCPELKDFVVFSSVACGRGNPGQSNYAFANSVMERICEGRKRSGLPALAVQWGPVGDVGIFADLCDENAKQDFGGMLAQPISSCLLTLDKLLRQDTAIVSSIVVATKTTSGASGGSPVDVVAEIMGIKDLKTVSQQLTLAELGMDSMMAVEIKQTLEREFEIFLTPQGIRTLTFGKLVELSPHREEKSSSLASGAGLDVLMRQFGDEEELSVPAVDMLTMVSDGTEDEDDTTPLLFLLPGIDGAATSMEPLCRGLRVRACALQLGVEHPDEDLDAMVSRLFHTVRALLAPTAPFTLLGYSFGCSLVLALAARLESAGHENGLVLCVDGAPAFNLGMFTSMYGATEVSYFQDILLCRIINIVAPKNNVTFPALIDELKKLKSFEDKIKYAVDISSAQDTKYTPKFISQVAGVLYDRLKVIFNFNDKEIKKINSPIVLVRMKENLPNLDCGQNYGLDAFTRSAVTVHYVEANHFTIIENKACADIINEVIFNKWIIRSSSQL